MLSGLDYAHDKRDDAGTRWGSSTATSRRRTSIISERGEVKMLDFGIVKAKQRVSQTDSGTVKGNVGFMSPEQARGKRRRPRAPICSRPGS